MHVPEIIAQREGFEVIHSHFASQKVSRADQNILLRQIAKKSGFKGMFLNSNRDQREWKLIYAEISKKGKNSVLQEMEIGPDKKVKDAVRHLLLLDKN